IDFNKTTLKPASFFELNILAEILKKKKNIRIEISGHTDNVGTNDYNLQLSRQRALAVKTFLEKKGTPASRLVTAGYGKTQPIADNTTDEGRALNRRVEFKIL
ncbi:MAG: OmpA family protein, partial [Bacteroidota bacterium]